MTTTRRRLRTGAATMTALGLVAAALATGSSAQGSPAASAPQDSFKLRSSVALSEGGARTLPSPSTKALRRAKAADRPDSTRATGRRLGSVTGGTGTSARGTRAVPRLDSTSTTEAVAADCSALELGTTPTNEWVGVHWKPVGTGNYAVWRMRDGGTWRLVRNTTGTEVRDTGVNPDSTYTYLVVADGVGECYTDEWVSMGTADGWGIPDAIYGGAGGDATRTGSLMWQDPYSTALPANLDGVDPAFSADGRKVVAAAHDDAAGWTIETMWTESGGQLTNKPVGAGHMGLNPEWSPDGTRVVYTRFVRADDGTLSAPELRLLTPKTGTDTLIAGSAGLLQADWRSSTTLIAAGFGAGEGLFTLPVAGGTKKAVAGTSNAGWPQVAPDGTTWFATGDGTNFSVSTLSPTGTVSVRQSSTASWWERPRIAPDGTVFVFQVDLHGTPNDDTDDTASVIQTPPSTWSPVYTPIGIATSDGLPGIFGYDVRQPKTRGTSDVVGDAGGDILARDSAGVMWAFPSTPDDFISPRVKVGSGWNIYSSFVAAGDLNSDNRGDIVAKDKSGNLWFYAGRGNAKFAARVLISSGWGSLSYLAPGDLDGYGADLLAIKPDGRMYLFQGNGTGTKFVARELGSGFQNFTVIGVGDFNYDNKTDLLSRDRTTGKLYLNAGLGGGKFSAKTVVGNSGWAAFTGFGTPEFDGFTGLYAREAGGAMRFYGTTGDGKFLPGYASVPGNWKPYLFSS